MRKMAYLLAAMLGTGSAHATAIDLDQWYSFSFNGVGTALANGSGNGINPVPLLPGAPAWTFTLTSAGTLTFLDGFNSGDQFEIFNFGSSLGTTSSASSAEADCDNDITACLANPSMGKGVFALEAGDYSITGIQTANAPNFPGGGVGFFVVSTEGAVPEPASWAMLVAGFTLAGAAMRRRRMAVSFA